METLRLNHVIDTPNWEGARGKKGKTKWELLEMVLDLDFNSSKWGLGEGRRTHWKIPNDPLVFLLPGSGNSLQCVPYLYTLQFCERPEASLKCGGLGE